MKRGAPKIRGTILRSPIIRSIKFWGLYWGPVILGKYQELGLGFSSGRTVAFPLCARVEGSGLFLNMSKTWDPIRDPYREYQDYSRTVVGIFLSYTSLI